MFKRHLDDCQRRAAHSSGAVMSPAAKRVRHNVDPGKAGLWDLSEDVDPDTLVGLLAAAAAAGLGCTLALMIADASERHVKRALYRVIHNAAAVQRICDAAGRIGRPDKVLERAASQCAHRTVGVLVGSACTEFEVACVLARLIKRGDREGVLAIVDACESSPQVSPVVYKRLVEVSMCKAAKRGALDTIRDLAPACDNRALRRVLIHCASRGYDIEAFEVVWEHADLCAHDLVDDIDPGAARDFLHSLIHKGDGCGGACVPARPSDGAYLAEASPPGRAHTDGRSALSV
ncbi:hypothetical protein [Pandoravirus japonicus]|uniref:Uncharacterized protein n=1 Tax=Pandoravirus japonicus TaxID=2823154 RepID=A0A811BMB7_9VIRU|nr:hypothetical protein [Pandoravirus belohorizontensis]BCU02933.1 hypothetical protein [Pandoravirus japonicus]